VAVRVHPVDHPAFANDMATIAGQAGHRLTHIMVPKVESVDDVRRPKRPGGGVGGPICLCTC
jgi:citrate lyase subunit beta/citryl-CoA lyase